MKRSILAPFMRTSRARLAMPKSFVGHRAYANEPSAKDIADQQHSGSRSTPRPTEATKTSTQRANDPPQTRPPGGQDLPKSQQQSVPEDEPGSKKFMAETKDDPNASLKGNTPFRAAPLEKSAG